MCSACPTKITLPFFVKGCFVSLSPLNDKHSFHSAEGKMVISEVEKKAMSRSLAGQSFACISAERGTLYRVLTLFIVR